VRGAHGVLIVSLAASACSSDTAGGGDCPAPEATLDALHTEITVKTGCALSSCHGGPTPEPNFSGPGVDLTVAANLCELIDRPSVTDAQARPLIERGSCADSYLMIKVDPARADEITTSDEYRDAYMLDASAMPQASRGVAGPPLCQGKIDALCTWIDEGCAGCP
jgi:hypothetical protein